MNLGYSDQVVISVWSAGSLDTTTTCGAIKILPTALLQRCVLRISFTPAAEIALAQSIAEVAVKAVVAQFAGKIQGGVAALLRYLAPKYSNAHAPEGIEMGNAWSRRFLRAALAHPRCRPRCSWRASLIRTLIAGTLVGLGAGGPNFAQETMTQSLEQWVRETDQRADDTFPSPARGSLLFWSGTVSASSAAAQIPTVLAQGGAQLSGQDAAIALEGLQEGSRYNAIVSLARNGRLRAPLSASEGAMILARTTQGVRAASIGEMARLFKQDLTGHEAATILGPASELSEGNRYNAIVALARAKRFGPSLGDDAALVLNSMSQGNRAAAIGEIAPYLRPDMRGQQIAVALGSEQILSEGNRYNAITALARADRLPKALTAAEGVPILVGTTQGVRAASIGEMVRFFASGLSGEDASRILGRNGETTEGNRYNAITTLARAGKLRPDLSGQEMTLVLQGVSDQARAAAIGEIASAAAKQATGGSQGPSTPPQSKAGGATSVPGSIEPTAPSKSTRGETGRCQAPNIGSNLKVPNPSCKQLWSYHVYRKAAIWTFSVQTEHLSKTESSAMKLYNTVERVNLLADYATKLNGAIRAVATTPDGAKKIFDAIWGTSGLALNLAPMDNSLAAEEARDLINLMREELSASAGYLMTGNAGAPVSGMVSLANRFGAWWNVQFKVLAEQNAINIAREYLTAYYRVGMDKRLVAEAYGAPANASSDDILRVISRGYVSSSLDYSLSSARRWVSSFEKAVADAAAVCEKESAC